MRNSLESLQAHIYIIKGGLGGSVPIVEQSLWLQRSPGVAEQKLAKLQRAPFWVYCSLLWVHVCRARHDRRDTIQNTFGCLAYTAK